MDMNNFMQINRDVCTCTRCPCCGKLRNDTQAIPFPPSYPPIPIPWDTNPIHYKTTTGEQKNDPENKQ